MSRVPGRLESATLFLKGPGLGGSCDSEGGGSSVHDVMMADGRCFQNDTA
ncbi:hypothetical protein VFPFJ_07844 [Purpureocillium lilacinum]|uniref:Uncharacterized protein n=1 Tax=Purpureocillium lilacinum TaxID=33203 RepID=A0A179H5J5_PURLI|nr:hypothetical protein VFPFJ_07844 [Purpureocillium lilacinum]OAQ77536.1 hypothetical protein VFPBJ_08008 [Purpureocillium lilacinum]OAQ85455.1 hypothetical protein VFPFJ_07844 [Purpureocillium lilacinum]